MERVAQLGARRAPAHYMETDAVTVCSLVLSFICHIFTHFYNNIYFYNYTSNFLLQRENCVMFHKFLLPDESEVV